MRSTVYKAITGIIALLGFIGGIVLGNTIKVSGFNTWIMICSWVSTALLCMIFYGIASALEYLEELGAGQSNSSNTQTSYNANNDRLSSETIFKDERQTEKMPVMPVTKEWKCPKCGKINQNYVGTCGCGESKPIKDDQDKWECPNCHAMNIYNDNGECPNCHWKP